MENAIDTAKGARSTEVSRSDDRVWAALAHGSALLMFVGPLVPVILWFTQRKKSPYVAFQSLQAMIYQSLFFWAYFTIIPFVLIVVMFVWMIAVAALAPSTQDPFLMGVAPQFAMWGVLLGAFALYVLIAMVGAAFSLAGRDFRYPLFGKRMARHLEYDGSSEARLVEEKEDRVVAAVSHSTCVLFFFGLLTPITVWLTQHERSPFLRFQALQAAIYQAIGLIGYFVFIALDMLLVFGTFGTALATDFAGRSSTVPGWLLLLMLPFLCLTCVFALGVPLYHLFGFLGSVSVLRGHDFRYPVLGGILASRMKPQEGT